MKERMLGIIILQQTLIFFCDKRSVYIEILLSFFRKTASKMKNKNTFPNFDILHTNRRKHSFG